MRNTPPDLPLSALNGREIFARFDRGRLSSDGGLVLLRETGQRMSRHWLQCQLTIRGDGHYASHQAMDWLEEQGHRYVFGLQATPCSRKPPNPGWTSSLLSVSLAAMRSYATLPVQILVNGMPCFCSNSGHFTSGCP